MKGVRELRRAIQSKSLTTLTKALGELAVELGYQLKPPYTEILQFKSQDSDDGHFEVYFEARLHSHYTNPATSLDGLIFTVGFGGDAFADLPTPSIHDLFYAGIVESFEVYGYGPKWGGVSIETPPEFTKNLEVRSKTINRIELENFLELLKRR